MQSFISACYAQRGKADHALAGTAYTLCMKLTEVLWQKNEFREELKRIMEREYTTLGISTYNPQRVYYYNMYGDRKYYTIRYYNDQIVRQEQDEKRRFWSRGVRRRWQEYVDELKPECERHLRHLHRLSLQS